VSQREQQLVDFAEKEYAAISQNTATSLQMMAVLLTLFFIFNGALLAATVALLGASSGWGYEPLPFFEQLKLIQAFPIGCFLLTLIFSLWAYYFVMSYREGVGIAVSRGSEIEKAAYAPDGVHGFFSRIGDWMSKSQSIRRLAKLSVFFFVLIELFWACLAFGNLLR